MNIDGYNTASRFERSPLEVGQSILDEVVASNDIIGTFPGQYDVPMVDSWQLFDAEEIPLALGFRRARAVLQALSFGEDYWRQVNGMAVELGERPAGESPEVTARTERLIQLTVLSRVPVRQVDEHWSVPSEDDICASMYELKKELFIANTPNLSDFSDITYDSLVEAILAGYVSVGNLEQPAVQCWRPTEPVRQSWLSTLVWWA